MVSICIFRKIDIQLCQHHLLKMPFFSLYNVSFFIKNQVFIGVWINIMVFNLILPVHLSVFMPISRCFYCCSSIVELDVGDGDVSRSSFNIQDCFWLSWVFFFIFPYEVEYFSFGVCEELCWDFDGAFIESVDCFS